MRSQKEYNVDAYDYLHNKKPDWMPDSVRAKLGKRGQLTRRAMSDGPYWELLLIGFDDPKKQKQWSCVLSKWIGDWHETMRRDYALEKKQACQRISDVAKSEGRIYPDDFVFARNE